MPGVCMRPQLSPNHLMPRFNARQQKLLEKLFDGNKNPPETDLIILATEADMCLFDIKVWFEDKLARWRQSQGFPASMRRTTEMV